MVLSPARNLSMLPAVKCQTKAGTNVARFDDATQPHAEFGR